MTMTIHSSRLISALGLVPIFMMMAMLAACQSSDESPPAEQPGTPQATEATDTLQTAEESNTSLPFKSPVAKPPAIAKPGTPLAETSGEAQVVEEPDESQTTPEEPGESPMVEQVATSQTVVDPEVPQTAQMPDEPQADALTNAVDPYDMTDQKIKFFKAVGNDNELDEKEFLANQKAGGGLVLPFEKWATALAFDANKNGSLDWFEFDAYRQAMRKVVLAAYDKNKDGKLTGNERIAALKALADGKVEIKPPVETPRGGASADAGDGQPGGSVVASQPASRPVASLSYEEAVKKYDKDGDGKLNNEERAVWQRDLRDETVKTLPAPMREFLLRNFDADRDGKFSDEEWSASRVFQKNASQTMMGWSLVFDKDTTEAERRETMQQVGMRIDQAMNKRANSDGQPSPEQIAALRQKTIVGMARYMERFEKQALADNGGKPSAATRAALLNAIDADIRDRAKKNWHE